MFLEGNVTIVTGAAWGIGKGIAKVFAQKGASVVAADVDERGGSETVDEIQAAGGKATFVRCDVSNAADCERLVRTAVEKYGRLNTLVNNAAIAKKATVTEMEERDWDSLLAVNLRGPFLLSKFAIPCMAAIGGGEIVNISSITGLVAVRDHAAYCASKAGVIGLTRAMALDHASQNIRVNAICPSGIVPTRQMDEYFRGFGDVEKATEYAAAQ